MRIIAGRLGGRTFQSPGSFKTHPMSDKMRGALFNMLGDIEGLTVLDAFAGSGALGFEAISRGASRVIAIDNDKAAQDTISKNIQTLGLEGRVKLIKTAAGAWLATSTTDNPSPQFDLVLCDPPYNDLQPNLLARLMSCKKAEGILVLSWPGDAAPPDFSGVNIVAERSYGDAQLLFYR